MIRILLVDDHPVVRDGLRGMLAGQPDLDVVGDVPDGLAALAAVDACEPDVVLMDLRMPGMDGVEAIRRLAASHPAVRVLVLTTFDEDRDIVRAVEAGAAGYLLKDSPRAALLDAIRAAAEGRPAMSPAVVGRLMGHLRDPGPDQPTARELEVLRMVARGMTNRAIASTLHISEATVKTHLVRTFAKLGVDDRTAAVTAAVSRGLIDLP
jgi:DNA-binding NarL/FixJ family response regulator